MRRRNRDPLSGIRTVILLLTLAALGLFFIPTLVPDVGMATPFLPVVGLTWWVLLIVGASIKAARDDADIRKY